MEALSLLMGFIAHPGVVIETIPSANPQGFDGSCPKGSQYLKAKRQLRLDCSSRMLLKLQSLADAMPTVQRNPVKRLCSQLRQRVYVPQAHPEVFIPTVQFDKPKDRLQYACGMLEASIARSVGQKKQPAGALMPLPRSIEWRRVAIGTDSVPTVVELWVLTCQMTLDQLPGLILTDDELAETADWLTMAALSCPDKSA